MSLKRNISWTLLGNLVYAASQWGMLIVIAKIAGTLALGKYSLGLAISAPVFAFCNLQLAALQATDANNEYDFPTYFGFRIISTLISIVVIICIAIFSNLALETTLVVILIGVAKSCESFSDISYGLLQKHEEMKKISYSYILKGVISLVSVLIGIELLGSVLAATILLAISWGLLFLLYDLRNVNLILKTSGRFIRPLINISVMSRLFWLALPMGFVVMLGSLNINIPRYFIVNQLGEKELGYYSAIAYIVVAGSMMINAIGQSLTPRLAKYYQTNINAYKHLLIKMFGFSLLIGVFGVLVAFTLGRQVLVLLYTKEYADYENLLIWMMILGCVLYCVSVLGSGITAARSFLSQAAYAPVVAGIIFLMSYFLIPSYGLVGGTGALIVGFFIMLLIQLFQMIHLTKVHN